MPWDNVEDAFRELDVAEFTFFAQALGSYRNALMKAGFTRRETMRLVESYSKFIYDMSLEDFMAQMDEQREKLHPRNETEEDNDDDDFGDLGEFR